MEHHAVALDLYGVAWRLGLTIFFVLLNGFFVAAEFALVKVRASRIDELAKTGRGNARRVQHILAHLDRYLSACQLGITLASLVLGALGEPAVSVLLIAAIQALGVDVSPEATWVPYVSIGIAFLVITMLHMTVGEQAPKMWALRRAERMSLMTSLPLRIFAFVFGPFIVAINAISNGMLRAIGLPGDSHHEASHTASEVRAILSMSAHAGHISEREHEITENLFRMMELEVRHIVVPRVDVSYLTLEKSLDENLQRIRTSLHSRLPLCEVALDSVVGFVHAKQVLDTMLAGETVDLAALTRPALMVPDTMSVSDFLLELQGRQEHCAVVVDEHGTAIGLAFREDALEEIVGPLGDEFDEGVAQFRERTNGSFELSGRMPLPEVCARLAIELTDGEDESEETVGGHVTARLGRFPQVGDKVNIGHYRATVKQLKDRRITSLVLEPVPEEDEAETEAETIVEEPAG